MPPSPFRLGLSIPALFLTLSPVFADPLLPLGPELSQYAPHLYRTDLVDLSSRLDLSRGPGVIGEPGPVLALAELHVAHGLWAEAGSFLDRLERQGLTGQDGARWDRLRLISALFDRTGSDPDPKVLLAAEDWADGALFRALAEAGNGEDLAQAADLIKPWPAPVRAQALPRLLELAIKAENWAVVRNLSSQVRTHPDIAGSPADLYLQGFAAERGGLSAPALEAYRRAADGRDFWAARARLAWADLALSSGSSDFEEVRRHLGSARNLWRGGELGLETLERLFEVTRNAGEVLGALDLTAEIRDRYPSEAERVIPAEDVWGLMETFYAKGASGEIAFGAFFDGHLRLFRSLATEPRYLDLVEGLAEDLAERGAFRLAGEEYRRVLDTLLAQAASPHIRIAPDRLDRTRLRLAEILLDAGQVAEASTILADPVREETFMPRQEALRARAFHALEDWHSVLTTWVKDPDPGHLSRLAQAHHALGEWEASRLSHIDVLEMSAERDPADIDRLILASFRTGNLAQDAELIRSFTPGDAPSLLETLLAAKAPATPMQRAAVEARLSVSDRLIGDAATLISARDAEADQR